MFRRFGQTPGAFSSATATPREGILALIGSVSTIASEILGWSIARFVACHWGSNEIGVAEARSRTLRKLARHLFLGGVPHAFGVSKLRGRIVRN
jgi:hypothetical protein